MIGFHLPMNNPAIDEMAGLPQWVLHKNKQPYNPHTGRPASSTDSKTWGTFDECATEGIQRNVGGPYDGVGFVFTLDTGIVGIDMDKCIKDNKPEAWAKKIIEDFDSYTEKSPSGNGYHIYVKGGLTGGRNRGGEIKGLEMYETARYFTVTGWHEGGAPETIEDRQKELNELYKRNFPQDGLEENNKTKNLAFDFVVDPNANPPANKFVVILENNSKFKRSWEHTRTDLNDTSNSGYDLSLATIAARHEWTDQEIIDLIAAHRKKYGDKNGMMTRKNTKALEDLLDKARKGVKTSTSDNDIVNIQANEEARSCSKEEKIERISNRLGVRIERVIKRGNDPATFYFVINGQELSIGSMAELLTQKRVRERIALATDFVIRQIRSADWTTTIEHCLSVKELQSLPGGDRNEETKTWVEMYLSGNHRYSHTDDNELEIALDRYSPFNEKDKVWISTNGLHDYLVRKNLQISNHQLLARLKEIGFQAKKFDRKFEQKRLVRWYWGINPEDLDLDDTGGNDEKQY
jgi:hypothetical protein